MIREVGEAVRGTIEQNAGRLASRAQEYRPLAADVLESDDAYLVVFDAPAAEGEDVQVRFADGTVFVRIDRAREFREGYDMRVPGRGLALDGEADLPEDASVDPEAATATLTRSGTVRIEVPKVEPPHDEPVNVDAETDIGSGDH